MKKRLEEERVKLVEEERRYKELEQEKMKRIEEDRKRR